MFKNYAVSALRSILNQKLYAVINILGLAIGLSACMLIILMVRHETSYDNFIPDLDRLYRLEATANIPGRDPFDSSTYVGPTKDLLPQDYPEVEEVLRIQQRGGAVVKEGESFPQLIDNVDPNFFRVFELPFVEGSPETALASPSSIVLSEEMARTYLGDGPYLGREIVINETFERTHVVSGVMRDIPDNSHLNLQMLVPIDRRVFEIPSGGPSGLDRWNGLPFYVYIKLVEGASIEPMAATINDWVDRYFPDDISTLVNMSGSELWTPRFVNVRDIHLYSPAQGGMKPPGSVTTLVSFGGIALLILVIASVNFVNLATARATLRSREVAVRKVMGASRRQLFAQFETESMGFTLISLLLAFVIVEMVLPFFNGFTGLEVPFSLILDPLTFSNVMALTLFVGITAGLHPALILSSVRPSRVLMANQSGVQVSTKLRAALVILQFAISATLFIATAIIYAQTNFVNARDLGFDKENAIIVRGLFDPQVKPAQQAFRDRIAELPGVTGVAMADFGPGDGTGVGLSVKIPGEADRTVIFSHAIDYDFFDLYDVSPLAGRLFSRQFPGDEVDSIPNAENRLNTQNAGIVVNMSAVRLLGFETPDAALGQILYRGRDDQVVLTVVGVVPDIFFSTPRQDMAPEIYNIDPANFASLNVRFQTDDPEALGARIDAIWNEMFPGLPATRNYLDENIASQFEREEIMGQLLAVFSGLAILVAAMGLFGLSSFNVARRTREIGIRKVMGATSGNIVSLLIKQMSVPVLIANVIAWPIGWLIMSEWLSNFTHRIELPAYFAGVALLGVIATLLIAWVTVAGHALKISRTSPIHALRYE